MGRFVAFLRGINVSGHRIVRMSELVQTFEGAGARDVSSFKASGNVAFTWPSGGAEDAARSLDPAVAGNHGDGIVVFVRAMRRLEELLRLHPFGAEIPAGDTPYLTFFARPPSGVAPGRSPRGDLDVLRVDRTEVFSLARIVGGRPGFPNPYFERLTGLEATTRNWATVRGIVAREAEGAPATSRPRSSKQPTKRVRR